MRHDPEQTAAAYLAGELDRRVRTRFECHLLDCEDCWRETNTARTGRMLAETLRETAPASLRERIRAVATLPPARPQSRRARPVWWPYTLVAAATVLVLVVVFIPDSTRPQPVALAEAATLYRTGGPQQVSRDEPPPVRRSPATSGGAPRATSWEESPPPSTPSAPRPAAGCSSSPHRGGFPEPAPHGRSHPPRAGSPTSTAPACCVPTNPVSPGWPSPPPTATPLSPAASSA